uniref:G_PROTEIN_RECEP_F1_2 domain-containing protein n=1 Tax=Heterorhabditis bacteriophora TaxID=37862 RepID=A0A1I7XGM7_HETBA
MVNRREISTSKSSFPDEIKDNWNYYPPFWYGVTNVVLSLILLTLCILVMIAMRRHEEYKKSASSKIMFRIAIFDVIQLMAHMTSGISLIFTADMPEVMNTVNYYELTFFTFL